uniref:NADP-dependent oxidoreductase domain-containing protein n=1 Tax=Strix occidentalis caurina TaxID=311401 RepID=A0A8D0FLK0_STROC
MTVLKKQTYYEVQQRWVNISTPKGSCLESVKIAIDTGYRHIDGAFVYYNEHEVGQAIREKIAEGKIKREDIFYCGKVRRSLDLLLSAGITVVLSLKLC